MQLWVLFSGYFEETCFNRTQTYMSTRSLDPDPKASNSKTKRFQFLGFKALGPLGLRAFRLLRSLNPEVAAAVDGSCEKRATGTQLLGMFGRGHELPSRQVGSVCRLSETAQNQ